MSAGRRKGPVDFEHDVLPVLRPNCLVCHNQTSAKAGLNLETPASMLKGGDSGPAIKPKHGSKSLLIQAAAHQIDPPMPPKENKAGAVDLTPEQLGMVRRWIDEGAKSSPPSARVIAWQALPPGLNPIYAVALTLDGQFAACGRANQIFVYHLPSGQLVTRLTDPTLIKPGLNAPPGVAHRDVVESLAFSPDGTRLASGSYREVKIWQRPPSAQSLNLKNLAPKSLTASAVSADGKWLAAAGENGSVHLWNLSSGKSARTINLPKETVNHLLFSPDGTKLAAADKNRITVWTVADGRRFAQATTASEVLSIVWLSNGRQLAAGSADTVIRFWTLPGDMSGELGADKELKGHTGAVTALATVASMTNQILSGSADGSVRLWNVDTGKPVRDFKHGEPVIAVAARDDGKRFASAGANHAARLWNAPDGKLIAELKGNRHANEFAAARERDLTLATNEIAFRKDALKAAETNLTGLVERVRIATTNLEANVKQFEQARKTFQELSQAKVIAEKSVEEFAPVKQAVAAAADAEKIARQADVAAKAAQGKPDQAVAGALATEAAVKAKAASDAKALADQLTAETKDKRKSAEDKLAAAVKAASDAEKNFNKAESAHSQAEQELQLASAAKTKAEQTLDESKVALAASEAQWTQARSDLESAWKAAAEAEKPIRALAFSADHKWLATAGDDGLVHTWSAENGAACAVWLGHTGAVNTVAFTDAGGLISIAQDRRAIVWDTNPAWTLERAIGRGEAASPLVDRVMALRFNPDGRLLATGGGEPSRSGEIKLWQTTTGKPVQTLTNIHSDTVVSLDFSPDGKLLVSGSADKFARITELATGKVVKSLEGHAHHVLGVAWKSDGRTLATAGAEGVVKIWDFPGGERRRNIEGYTKEVTSIQFIGVTDQALTTAGDGKVRLVRENGSEVRTFPGSTDFVYAAAATPDGSVIVAGGQDGVLRVWNGNTGQSIANFPPPAAKPERAPADIK